VIHSSLQIVGSSQEGRAEGFGEFVDGIDPAKLSRVECLAQSLLVLLALLRVKGFSERNFVINPLLQVAHRRS